MRRRTFLKIISSAGMVGLLDPSFAEQVGDMIINKSIFPLKDAFCNPPSESGVYTWWHWMNGNITKDGITRDLEAMKECGIAGFQLFEAGTGIPEGAIKSLSDEWRELVIYTIKEAERLGLEFAMHNCPGWSSSGGPWITPDKAMQQLTWSKLELQGGRVVHIQLPVPKYQLGHYIDTYCLAVPAGLDVIPQSSVLDLTGKLDDSGMLEWDAPIGKWLILRFGQTARKQYNRSAPNLSTGLECDKFNTEALDYHLDCMFKWIMPVMESMSKRSKIGLLIDSYEMGSQDWTYDMPDYFEEKRGYSLLKFLPVFSGIVVESNELTSRFRFDFRRTQADMFADRYYSHFQKRCKEKGIITYTEPYGGNMMEELQVAQRLDINMGEFWAGQTVLWANYKYNRTVKQIASTAHALGKRIVGAEAFTAEADADKWLLYPYALKSLGDYMFTQGLTRIYFHRYAHQPHPTAAPGMTMGPWGLHFERTNTWWKPGKVWIEYLNRCQYIFQNLDFYGDILYLKGDDAFGETIEPEKTSWAPPEGYDYDLINAELLEKVEVDNKKIKLPGTRFDGYKLLVLLQPEAMSLHTLGILSQLVKKGVILVGKKPLRTLGVLDAEQEDVFHSLVKQIWESDNVFEEETLSILLKRMNVSPDFVYYSNYGESAVHAIHYFQTDADFYFIANRRRIHECGVAHFKIKNRIPEFWNPYTAEISPCLVYRIDDDGIVIPLNLPPTGSMFVCFKKNNNSGMFWSDVKYNGLSLFFKHCSNQIVSNSNMHTDFSISCWIKPELDIAISETHEMGNMRTRFFAIYPHSGEKLYGKGHSSVGLSVGRNGLVVYERTIQNKAVFRCPMPISGWTHLVLSYHDNTPNLWINGKYVGHGPQSTTIVHYVVGSFDKISKSDTYEGGICGLSSYSYSLEEEQVKLLFSKEIPEPYSQQKMFLSWRPNTRFVAWMNGKYEFVSNKVHIQKQIDGIPKRIMLDGSWIVCFPEKSGAPDKIVLPKLRSLRLDNDFGVRHFSGTMSYFYELFISNEYLDDGLCLRLDLGRVEVIAEIWINGQYVTTCWAPPYYADIEKFLLVGKNKFEIRVTNLWVNRLIGDEYLPQENEYIYKEPVNKYVAAGNGGIKQLPKWYLSGHPKPEGGRITFTTWKHYDKDSPLVESGLLGPVVLIPGIVKDIK